MMRGSRIDGWSVGQEKPDGKIVWLAQRGWGLWEIAEDLQGKAPDGLVEAEGRRKKPGTPLGASIEQSGPNCTMSLTYWQSGKDATLVGEDQCQCRPVAALDAGGDLRRGSYLAQRCLSGTAEQLGP